MNGWSAGHKVFTISLLSRPTPPTLTSSNNVNPDARGRLNCLTVFRRPGARVSQSSHSLPLKFQSPPCAKIASSPSSSLLLIHACTHTWLVGLVGSFSWCQNGWGRISPLWGFGAVADAVVSACLSVCVCGRNVLAASSIFTVDGWMGGCWWMVARWRLLKRESGIGAEKELKSHATSSL